MMHRQLQSLGTPRSGLSTALKISSHLLIVSLLLQLCACSTSQLETPQPRLQANLAQPCPPIPPRPVPFLDPDRLLWENRIVAQLGDCGLRHILTVEAWPAAAAE